MSKEIEIFTNIEEVQLSLANKRATVTLSASPNNNWGLTGGRMQPAWGVRMQLGFAFDQDDAIRTVGDRAEAAARQWILEPGWKGAPPVGFEGSQYSGGMPYGWPGPLR